MPQSHFSSIEMEEIHELHRLAFTKSCEIDSFGFVIQFELNRVYLDMFYLLAFPTILGNPAHERMVRWRALSLVLVFRQRLRGVRN